MKFCLPVVLALLATLLQSIENVTAKDICPLENCLDSIDKCDIAWIGGVCPGCDYICCSVLKPQYRTHCHHYGGECHPRCVPSSQRPAIDCPEGTVCCTMV